MDRIVSGGQTGADRAALDFAIRHGISHGGWCPRGRMAEDGAIAETYALRETPTSDYAERTEWNVRDSDATVIVSLTGELTGESKYTAECARRLGKPWVHLSPAYEKPSTSTRLRDFVEQYRVRTLNVAGPRESEEPGIGAYTTDVLFAAFGSLVD